MASATQLKVARITAQPDREYSVRFWHRTVEWDDTNPPNYPAYVLPSPGNYTDISQYVQEWRIEKRTRQLCATLSLTLMANADTAILRATDYSDLVDVWIDMRGGGESHSFLVGRYLVDRVSLDEETGDSSGNWEIEARDTMKCLMRRRYFGNLEPDTIEEPGAGAWQDMVMDDVPGLDYYELYDGTGPTTHTVNWATLPKPLFRVKGTTDPIVPDGENMVVLFGDGVVRMSKEWYLDAIGSGKTLQVQYYRYALWEDTWLDPTLRLNTPMDILADMADWAGFRTSIDTTKLCRLLTIEAVTSPEAADFVIDDDGNDVTSDAAGEGSGVNLVSGSNLYVGVTARAFPAIHFFFSSGSDHAIDYSDALKYHYWDGAAWQPIAPDLDATNDGRQNGQVSWLNQALVGWVKGQYAVGVQSIFWLKIEVLPGTDFDATAAYLLVGHPIQIEPVRIDTTMDLKPADVLERYVYPSCPPNYRWYASAYGAMYARYDVLEVADPDFELSDTSRVAVTADRPHDDEVKGIVIYRGLARQRFNSGLHANGAYTLNLLSAGDDPWTFRWLVDGNILSSAELNDLFNDDPPVQFLELVLGGTTTQLDVREFSANRNLGEGVVTIVPTTPGITWTYDPVGTAVTDDSDASWGTMYYYGVVAPINSCRVTFTTPRNISKIAIRLSHNSAGPVAVQVTQIADQLLYRTIATAQNDTDVPTTYTFEDLGLLNVVSIQVHSLGRTAQYANSSGGRLYDLDVWEWTEDTPAGTWTAEGGTGVVESLHDADIETGMVFTKRRTGFDLVYAAPVDIDNIHLYSIIHGTGVIEWQQNGSTNWTPAIVVSPGMMGERIYPALGWTNVDAVRFRLTKVMPLLELSEVEVFTVGVTSDDKAPANYRIEYTTLLDPGNWRVLCAEADGAAFGAPQWSVDKGAFGEELFIDRLRFTLLSWGKDVDENRTARLSEIRVWCGDVLWGKATLGWTAPYDTAADLALQGIVGWKSELFPPEPDITAVTQEIVDFRALQILKERLRRPSELHATDTRLDVDLGQTVELPSHIQDMCNVDYAHYLITAVVLSGSIEEPLAEILVLP